MTQDQINELLRRAGSDLRVHPGEPDALAMYTLLTAILDRLEAQEAKQ